jgi:hypothetical protein
MHANADTVAMTFNSRGGTSIWLKFPLLFQLVNKDLEPPDQSVRQWFAKWLVTK